MTTSSPFHIDVDLNVLNHLGIGLYSSTPAVVTEIVANAWDADATRVDITISDDEILVHDDGHGMGVDELQGRFLKVGYARREQPGGNLSPRFSRKVMGRKGIGKLAMFSLANRIDLWSKMDGRDAVGCAVDVGDLREKIKKNVPYELEDASADYAWQTSSGTRIRLSQLNKGTDKTEAYLRPRIARRFSVIGERFDFSVFINGREVTAADRAYQNDLQFLWYLPGGNADEYIKAAKNLAKDEAGELCAAQLDGLVQVNGRAFNLSGFIGTVFLPKQLKKTDGNINQISLFANGRVFQEDLLKDIGNAKHFNSYLVGEIHADFLDGDEVDRATASREAVKAGDPLVTAVRAWLMSALAKISDQWDEWRRQQNVNSDDSKTQAALDDWYRSLSDSRDVKLAKRLITPILSTEYSNDERSNQETRRDLVKSAIIAFEKLRIRKQLDLIPHIADVTSPEFQKIFHDLDDVEATHYHEITRGRLQVIEKFEKSIVEQEVLEKVAQAYLFEHLWLLDPTWGPVGDSKVMEQELTKELKKCAPDAETGARLDIAYRTSSARHVIVELKRPGLKAVDVYNLMKQGDKYRAATQQYLRKHPDFGGLHGRELPVDVYFVTEERPRAVGCDPLQVLRARDMQAFTYKGMIGNARRAYQEYLDSSAGATRIEDIIKNIG